MTNKELLLAIRKTLKEAGYTSKDVRVRYYFLDSLMYIFGKNQKNAINLLTKLSYRCKI